MASLVPVDNKKHSNLKVDPNKVECHGADLHLIPVVLSEFVDLAVQYPIVLAKNEETGKFAFTVLLGFEVGENLYWQNEEWQGLYLPLQIRRQPFSVSQNDSNNNGDYDVFIDTESPTIVPEGGASIFDDRGFETEFFQQSKSCLVQLLSGEADNQWLLECLQNMDLIEALSLDITFSNQKLTKLNGLYTINQDKLEALNDEQLLTLHKTNLLSPIYTLINSLGQIHALIDLKNQKIEKSKIREIKRDCNYLENNMFNFVLNPALTVSKILIGDEKTPILIIDNFVEQPQNLVALAEKKDANNVDFQLQKNDYYPGVRKPAPEGYREQLDHLLPLIKSSFMMEDATSFKVIFSAFSIVNTQVEKLRPIQMLPHFDTAIENQYAIVHFLCDAKHGGTSFYQHKKSGFERINEQRFNKYATTLKNEAVAEKLHENPQYIDDDNKLFKQIHTVEARMNRAIIYPSNLLHSGDIHPEEGLLSSPKNGRLTISSFFVFK
jgi:hypothetical protein